MTAQHGVHVGGTDFRPVADREATVRPFYQSVGDRHVLPVPRIAPIKAHLERFVPGQMLFLAHHVLWENPQLAAQDARYEGNGHLHGPRTTNQIVIYHVPFANHAYVVLDNR